MVPIINLRSQLNDFFPILGLNGDVAPEEVATAPPAVVAPAADSPPTVGGGTSPNISRSGAGIEPREDPEIITKWKAEQVTFIGR
jgi:hypothetical protein